LSKGAESKDKRSSVGASTSLAPLASLSVTTDLLASLSVTRALPAALSVTTALLAALSMTAAVLALCLLTFTRVEAMPVFAQRYQLTCKTCHTVLPELNDFGNNFRNRGYRLPANVPRHGTTIAALRYNVEWERDPSPGARRFTPSASILGDADVGAVNAYLHYTLGSSGAPSGFFLGFLSYHNEPTKSLYRAGLYELPLTHSPGQRLDSVSGYGYEGISVGHNDLSLSAPRLGLEEERTTGSTRLAGSLSFGEFKGAAYGGAPISTGTTTVNAAPELALFAKGPLFGNLDVNGAAIEGSRRITLPGRMPADDAYRRFNAGLHTSFFHKRLDLEAQQWIGRDDNADALGDPTNSSGGWARLKYFVTPHLFAAARYDAQAAPIADRNFVFYVGTFLTPHARLTLQRSNDLFRGGPTYGGDFTIAIPWPARL